MPIDAENHIMKQPLLFDHFQANTLMGQHVEVFEPSFARAWRTIFDLPDSTQPYPGELSSLALAMAMRAYLTVVSPRPPGNVHARQQFQMHSLPDIGETVTTQVVCVGKEIRRERRYVDLQVQASGRAARPLFTGEMRLIWAA
jgi:hypothetical protein